jgi:hypothetical protein
VLLPASVSIGTSVRVVLRLGVILTKKLLAKRFSWLDLLAIASSSVSVMLVEDTRDGEGGNCQCHWKSITKAAVRKRTCIDKSFGQDFITLDVFRLE